jgi:hypothetical protein
LDSDRIDGEDCPTGAGRLEGRKRGETSISIRLVGPNRQLISGYSARLAEENSLSAPNILTLSGCTFSSSQNNTATFQNSGTPIDGAIGPQPAGTVGGSLFGKGNVGKYAEFSGCMDDPMRTATKVPCTLTGTGTELFLLAVDVELPAGDGPARVRWHLRPPDVGDVPPTISPCLPWPLRGPLPDPVTTHVARNLFLDPGTHSIAVDAPATVAALGGIGTINSTAHYELTFKRVNEDGSPYTG